MPDTHESTYRVWDLVQHVEEHRDDYMSRWRLAKKLYAAWEYDLALEHLLVLKEEWDRKLNVLRYLAATYYRLGRYEDSMSELRDSIKLWPREIGPREQLARVQEAAGLRDEAAETWRRIQELEPRHPIARSAFMRLTSETGPPTPQRELHIGDSDSGIDLSPGQVCPNCGAQNSDEFERCWQCHARLASVRSSGSRSRTGGSGGAAESLQIAAGLALVGVLSLCFWLSFQLLLAWRAQENTPQVLNTLQELYDTRLGLTRVLSGVVMAFSFPLLLNLAIGVARPERSFSPRGLKLAAMLLGTGLFAATWVPIHYLPGVLLGGAVVWAGLLLWLSPLSAMRTLKIWALHLGLVTTVTYVAFTASEYQALRVFFNPFMDLPALVRHAQSESAQLGVVELPAGTVPYSQGSLLWQSTGSAWLDRRVGPTEFQVQTAGDLTDMRFELQGPGGTKLYERVSQSPWAVSYVVKPMEPYEVRVTGVEGAPVQVRVAGILRLSVGSSPLDTPPPAAAASAGHVPEAVAIPLAE
jgi:hypothetical protein